MATGGSGKNAWWEWAEVLIIAVALTIIIRVFIVQQFTVYGISMLPNFHTGERVLVNQFIYRFEPIEDGQVIVLRYPLDPKTNFIKRVVATPGQTLRMLDGQLYINGKKVKEPWIKYPGHADFPLGGGVYKVPAGRVFVMGDNRPNSLDSRYFGAVPYGDIIGEVFLIFWPPGNFQFI
jgi:signal peptidase I